MLTVMSRSSRWQKKRKRLTQEAESADPGIVWISIRTYVPAHSPAQTTPDVCSRSDEQPSFRMHGHLSVLPEQTGEGNILGMCDVDKVSGRIPVSFNDDKK